MRRLSIVRDVVVLSFAVLVAMNASAVQNGTEVRERIGAKERFEQVVRVVKKAIRSLGDGLVTPRP
jgi:hypothetical protein